MKPNIYKPILFSTEMVQAILAGRKTQTRRIVKPQPNYFPYTDSKEGHEKTLKNYIDEGLKNGAIKGKYHIGDILWVRETTKVGAWREDECKIAFDYKASPELKKTPWCFFEEDKFEKLHLETIEALDKKGFEADIDEEREYCTYHWEPGESPLNWKPSLFMPKEASRIFLKVTNVRCERLQDINRGDAMSEGCPFPNMAKEENPVDWFSGLWNSINAKKYPWESNPWVWVYDFERIEKPENFI